MKCQGFVSCKNHFQEDKSKRLQVETGFYFSESVSELMLTSINTMSLWGRLVAFPKSLGFVAGSVYKFAGVN